MYDAFTERELAEQYPTQGEDRLTKGDRLHRDGPAALQAIEKDEAGCLIAGAVLRSLTVGLRLSFGHSLCKP